MRSMVKDLEQDETNIQKSITDETRTIQIADSLIEMFHGNNYKNKTGLIYYSARDFATLPHMFYLTDGTLIQLKNSGGLRLIRKQQVVDSLQGSYNTYQWYKTGQELENVQIDDYRSSMAQALHGLRTARKVVQNGDFDSDIAPKAVQALQLAEGILDTTDIQVQACLFGGIQNHDAQDHLRQLLSEQILDVIHAYKVQGGVAAAVPNAPSNVVAQ